MSVNDDENLVSGCDHPLRLCVCVVWNVAEKIKGRKEKDAEQKKKKKIISEAEERIMKTQMEISPWI